MAQIIKHRRGSLSTLKDVTARIGELVMTTGSINDLNGPMVFIGETEGVAGAYRPLSKIYQGTTAPTISVGSYGSVIDGTPFYSSGNKSLNVLSQAGNNRLDLTGNIEGNTIANVTITSLTGSNGNITNLTGSTFTSTNSNITSLTGSNLSVTNVTAGTLSVTGTTNLFGDLYITGNTIQTGSIDLTGNVKLGGNITIGDATTDFVAFGAEISSSIVPDLHDTFDLGSSDKNWRNLHVSGTAYVNTLQANQVNFTDLSILEDLTVSGNTFLGNGGDILIVSGSAYYDTLTDNRVVIAGTNGLLEDDANFTFDGTTLKVGNGDFEVDVLSGDTRISGSLLVKSGTTITGSLNVTGSVELKGNTTVTGSLNVTGSANVVGPVDVKGDTKLTGSLDVSGSANVVGPVDIKGDTKMTGSLFATNIKGTGSLYLQADQTDGRYFEIYNTAASDTHIKSNQGLSFFGDDTNYLLVNDGAQTVSITGMNGVFVSSSLGVTGSLDVSGSAEFKNNVGITGTLDVTGSSVLKSTLEVKGATGLNSTLDVTGSTVLKSTLEGRGAVGLNSTLDVTGSTILKDTLQVNSTTQLKGAVGLNSTLDVTGSAQFKGTINVDGESTLASATVEDLTQDRIVTVGAGGSLIDSSGFTYNGTVLKIGNGQFEVDTNDGDIRTSGSLTIEGTTTINDNLNVTGVLTVTGNTLLQSNLFISGNLQVLGSATSVMIQSQTVELDDNIIRLNAYSPFERYAGIEVIDSGSSNTSASFVWDSTNDYWMFVSASGQSSKLIGTTAGSYGSETSLTIGTIPKATGLNNIGDSLLTENGTTLSYNTNKFQVTASNGDTLIAGNVTLSFSGGTDNGTKTSTIVFKNSSNVLGYVSTTETTDVLDGILGYKNSDGMLKFSTVIDGGTY